MVFSDGYGAAEVGHTLLEEQSAIHLSHLLATYRFAEIPTHLIVTRTLFRITMFRFRGPTPVSQNIR